MFPFHRHRPRPTGIFINAGYRKNNLPKDSFVVVTRGQMWACECKEKFVEMNGQLHELDTGEADQLIQQYDCAGIN